MSYKAALISKTKNLFNIDNFIDTSTVKRNGNSLICSSYGTSIGELQVLCPSLKVGDTVTVSFKTASEGVASNYIQIDKNILRSGDKFTVSETGLTSQFYLYSTIYEYRDIPNKTTYYELQLELDSTATSYVPYGYIQSYKSKLKVSDTCQLVNKREIPTTQTISGVTFTNNGDGSVTVNGTATNSGNALTIQRVNLYKDHIYFVWTNQAGSYNDIIFSIDGLGSSYILQGNFFKSTIEGEWQAYFWVKSGATISNRIFKPQFFDLTEMYGSGNEPKTVAEFRQKFPNEMYDYSPNCFVTSYKSCLIAKTKNLCDFARILTLPLDRQFVGTGFFQVEISVEPNTQYTLSRENGDVVNLGATYLGMDNVSRANHPAGFWLNHEALPAYCKQQITIESNTDGKLWIFFSNVVYTAYKNGQNPFGYLQLEKGTTATEYVPYGYL